MSTGTTTRFLFESTYAPLYFATAVSTSFYGISCMQTFYYCTHSRNDPLRIKSFVAALWTLDTVHEALVISGVYKYIMTGFSDPFSTVDGIFELILQIVFTTLVAIPTQGFFVYRIYVFSEKNIVVPLICVPLGIYQLASTGVYVERALRGANSIHVTELGVLGHNIFVDTAISILSVAAAVDILTTVFLTFLLVRKRTTAEYASAVHVLQRLILFAVNTGTWTTMFSLLTLVLMHIYPSDLIYAVFGLSLGSVYCNTLLANLNARGYIRDEIIVDPRMGHLPKTERLSRQTRLVHPPGYLEQYEYPILMQTGLSRDKTQVRGLDRFKGGEQYSLA